MQLLFQSSSEGSADCLGVIPAQVQAIDADQVIVPHMGWNRNYFVTDKGKYYSEVADGFYGYFVHSFAAPIGPWTIAKCRHGQWFSSMVRQNNFWGIQFHPERSSRVGQQLLRAFLAEESSVSMQESSQ